MSDKICTYCGQAGHRAHECPRRAEQGRPHCFDFALDFVGGDDEVALRLYVDDLEASRARLLRKFDAYVPADQASSMRWRILELEAQVTCLQTYQREFGQRCYMLGVAAERERLVNMVLDRAMTHNGRHILTLELNQLAAWMQGQSWHDIPPPRPLPAAPSEPTKEGG